MDIMVMKKEKPGHVRVGTSGYVYEHWQGLFYPADLPKSRRFEYYASQFDTVEMNATFYHLFEEKTFDKWHDRSPENFLYAIKLWRWITHRKRLKGIDGDLKTFFERMAHLKAHLGPVLIQLPPGLHRDDARLEDFLELCEKTQKSLKTTFRYAVEFRHKSWFDDGIYDLLSRHKTALVLPDMPVLHGIREVTTDFIYVRFHGHTSLYGSLYSPQSLTSWATWLRGHLEKGIDVYAYFNNDMNAYATKNATMLRRYLTD